MAGVDRGTVQELGGRRTLSMVMRCAHLSPAHLQAATERLVTAPAQDGVERGLKLDLANGDARPIGVNSVVTM